MSKHLKHILAVFMVLTITTCSIFQLDSKSITVSANTSDDTNIQIEDVNQYDSNEIIVTYKDDIDTSKIASVLSSSSETTETLNDQSVLLSLDNENDLANAIEELSEDDSITSIQPNYTYELLDIPEDKYFTKQWGLYNNGTFVDEDKTTAVSGIDINVTNAWDVFSGGRDVIVAVIDTGVDYTHEDLKNVMWTNENEIAGDGIDNDGNGFVDDVYGWNFYSNNSKIYNTNDNNDDHGTHVAGIIAASRNTKGIAGVASNANVEIMSVKALGGYSKSGTTASIIKAISYAEANGASICNLSFGVTSDDTALKKAINSSNMIFVCAAGNGNSKGIGINIDSKPMYPASYDYDNIISVANLTCNGTLHTSSNYGKTSVDVAAPGTTISSTIVGNKYAYMTGTSMAAPMVTGVLAMIYSYYDGITPLQAKEILLSTVNKLPELEGKVATGGLVDAYAALTLDQAKILALDTTAPNITTKIKSITNSYKKSLKVTVKDPENNLYLVRYAKGKKTVDYFENREKGKNLKLKSGSASINVSETANYTIYALDMAGNERVKTVKVTVTPPTKITTTTKKSLKVGKSFTLKTTFTPTSTKATLTYTTSNKKVATVNSSGKVTAKKKGTATITITSENGLTTKCKVTVSN